MHILRSKKGWFSLALIYHGLLVSIDKWFGFRKIQNEPLLEVQNRISKDYHTYCDLLEAQQLVLCVQMLLLSLTTYHLQTTMKP